MPIQPGLVLAAAVSLGTALNAQDKLIIDANQVKAWQSIEGVTALPDAQGVRLVLADSHRNYGNASLPIEADWSAQYIQLDIGQTAQEWYVGLSGSGLGYSGVATGQGPASISIDPSRDGTVTDRGTLHVHVGIRRSDAAAQLHVRKIILRPKPAVRCPANEVDTTRDGRGIVQVFQTDGTPFDGLVSAVLPAQQQTLTVNPEGSGRFRVTFPAALPTGAYAVRFSFACEGPREEIRWFRLRTPVLACDRLAFPASQPIQMMLTLRDPNGNPCPATPIEAHINDRPIPLSPQASGQWRSAPLPLGPGNHRLTASAGKARLVAPLYVSPGNFIRSDRTQFRDSRGEVFTPLGVEGGDSIRNGKQPRWAPFASWPVASDETIEAHCAYHASCGINVLRVALNPASGCMDTGDGVGFSLAVKLARFLAAMNRHGIRAQLVLYWGLLGNYGFTHRTAPGYAEADDWYRGPLSRQRQLRFIRELTALFADDDRIFAWEIQNELTVGGDLGWEHPKTLWVHALRDEFRRQDRNHPVGISYLPWGSGRDVDPLVWARQFDCDFFQFHYGLDASFLAETRYGQLGNRPFFAGEFGTSRTDEACEARISRDCIWWSLLAGSGAIGWHQDWVIIEQFRVPAELLKRYRWSADNPRTPPLRLPTTQPWGSADTTLAKARECLQRAEDFQPFPAGEFAKIPPLRKLAPLQEPARPWLHVVGRYGGASRQGSHMSVAYLCNMAAIRRWDGYGGPIDYRDPKPTPLTVHLNCEGECEIRIYDAATGQQIHSLKATGPSQWSSDHEARDLVIVAGPQ